MKAALSRLLLAGILAPAVAQAQSTTPTPATIRLYEQTSGNVLGAEKRVYTSYFNTLRTRYIGVEVTLEYPAAAEASRLSVGCQMTRPDGRVIEGIWKLGMTISAGSTSAVGANVMFGAGRDGWQTGIHKVTCAGAGPLGEVSFQMSPGPSLLTDLEFRLKEVRFFPTGARINPIGQRSYQDLFTASEATRIGIELSFLHPGLTKGGAGRAGPDHPAGPGSVQQAAARQGAGRNLHEGGGAQGPLARITGRRSAPPRWGAHASGRP